MLYAEIKLLSLVNSIDKSREIANTCIEVGLEKWIVDSTKDGVGYKVKVGKEQIGEGELETLHYPWSEREVFSVTPVLMGAGKGGWGKVLTGALLIGGSILLPGAAPALAGTMFGAGSAGASALAVGIANVGLGVSLKGVSELLSPTPPVPEEAETLENYAFSGIDNVAKVGTPVPIAYGRLFVGSSVISSGLDVDQLI